VIVFATLSSWRDHRERVARERAASSAATPSVEMSPDQEQQQAAREEQDDVIEQAVEERLGASRATADEDLNVKVKDGVVTLRGTVPTEATSQVAEALAETVPGVTEVRNEIEPKQRTSLPAGPRVAVRPAPPVVVVPRVPGVDPVDPNSPEGQALRGLLRRGQEALDNHRPELAMRHYGAAIELDPTSKEAATGMAKATAAMAGDWTRFLPFRNPDGPRGPRGRNVPAPPTPAPPAPTPES
jgi:hypothetical protein